MEAFVERVWFFILQLVTALTAVINVLWNVLEAFILQLVTALTAVINVLWNVLEAFILQLIEWYIGLPPSLRFVVASVFFMIVYVSARYKFGVKEAELLIPHVKELRGKMRKARLGVSFRSYTHRMFFRSFVAFVAALIYLPMIFEFLIKPPIPFLLSLGLGLMAGFLTFLGHYLYPSIKMFERRFRLNMELPYTIGYMSVLATAGATPERIFKTLATLNIPVISDEAKDLLRDVELLGYDLVTAIEEAMKRTPSGRFMEILQGISSTIMSGGDLKEYLMGEAGRLRELHREETRKATSSLWMTAEIYVSLSVVGPLVFVIMLSMIGLIGGVALGMDPISLTRIMVYLVVPVSSLLAIILVSSYVRGE